jgi:hypothetical protein
VVSAVAHFVQAHNAIGDWAPPKVAWFPTAEPPSPPPSGPTGPASARGAHEAQAQADGGQRRHGGGCATRALTVRQRVIMTGPSEEVILHAPDLTCANGLLRCTPPPKCEAPSPRSVMDLARAGCKEDARTLSAIVDEPTRCAARARFPEPWAVGHRKGLEQLQRCKFPVASACAVVGAARPRHQVAGKNVPVELYCVADFTALAALWVCWLRATSGSHPLRYRACRGDRGRWLVPVVCAGESTRGTPCHPQVSLQQVGHRQRPLQGLAHGRSRIRHPRGCAPPPPPRAKPCPEGLLPSMERVLYDPLHCCARCLVQLLNVTYDLIRAKCAPSPLRCQCWRRCTAEELEAFTAAADQLFKGFRALKVRPNARPGPRAPPLQKNRGGA